MPDADLEVRKLPDPVAIPGAPLPEGYEPPVEPPVAEPSTAESTPAPQEISGTQQLSREQQIQQRLDQLQTERRGLMSGSMQATQTEIARRQQAAQQREPLLKEAESAVRQPAPQMPAETQMPQAPSGPIVDPQQFKEFFGPALLFSVLLGRVAKGDMIDGLNMLSNSITGYVMGAKEKAANNYEQFKQKFEAARASETEKIARYRAIIEEQKYNVQQKMQLLDIEAYREEDRRMQFALLQKNWDMAIKTLDAEEKMVTQMSGSYDKLQASIETGVTRIEVANIQAAARREATANLDRYRSRLMSMRLGNDMNKVLAEYQKESKRIADTFERTVAGAVQRAGTNPEMVGRVKQMAAELAAEEFVALNALSSEAEFVVDGKPMHLNTNHDPGSKVMEDPNYWIAKTRGFESLSKYIPPVTMPGASSAVPPKVMKGGERQAAPIEPAAGGTQSPQRPPPPPGFEEQ